MAAKSTKANRLARLVYQPGGFTLKEAVDSAQANIENIRETVMEEVDKIISSLQLIVSRTNVDTHPFDLNELYKLSNNLIGLSGVVGSNSLTNIAYSLCELTDRNRHSNTWSKNAVQLHVDCFRLILTGNAPPEKHVAIVTALREIVEKSGHNALER